MKADELRALAVAKERFTAWRELTAHFPVEPDRAAFNGLLQATKQLSAALARFEPSSGGNMKRLLAWLQHDQGMVQPQAAYQRRLDELVGFLGDLQVAAAHEAGTGRPPNNAARVWIWCAADAWLAVTKKVPSAAESGRFWLALFELQAQLDAAVPTVNRDAVKSALEVWRTRRVEK